jgi:phosphoglycerate kinase
MFEIKKFSKGTEAIARAIADCKAVTLAGGGDTDVVIDELGIFDRLTHVSTAGGALLEFLEGRKLPGIEVLTNKN